MMRISARKLLAYTSTQLWDMLTGTFILVMDDGEIETDYKRTCYSSIVWEYHRRYPGAPLLKAHHLDSVLKGRRLKEDTHRKLIGEVCWSVYDHVSQGLSEEQKELLRDDLMRLVDEIRTEIYNDLMYRSEEHVTSLDIMHFHEVFMHPEVQKVYEDIPETVAGIEVSHRVIADVMGRPELKHNQLCELHASGLVKRNQLMQCLGPRGFITDTNSKRFIAPVMRGYFEGIVQIKDSMIESRSAAKSLELSKDTLRNSEYFARRLQLVSMSLENLHQGDCGTGRYLRWKVRGRIERDGVIEHDGDLQNLVGSMYLDENGQLKTIRPWDLHLVGKTINIRSILHCAHPDPAGVCATCVGEMALSMPMHSNIGHLASTYMTQQSTQGVLSVKHLDANAELEVVMINDADRFYLKVGSDKNSYALADTLKKYKVSMVISANAARTLTDVMEIDDVRRLAVARISELTEVGIIIDDGKMVTEGTAQVHQNRRYSSLTHKMLAYIKEVGWTLSPAGHYVIDLKGWDFSEPILALPAKQYNMGDHSKDIASMLESGVEEIVERDRFINPEALLVELFDFVNSKLSVNLKILEIPFYAGMIVSAENYNYSLPKPWTDSGLGVMRRTMDYRSLSTRMAYERHQAVIQNPDSYTIHNRPDSPFDMIFMPREVLESGTRQR